MAADRARLVADAYRRQLTSLRRTIERRVLALYGAISPEDLDASFAAFFAAAAPLITAGQASASTLSAAYLRSLFSVQARRTVDPAPPPDGLIGRTELGLPIIEGMAAFPALVKGQIGAGKPLAEALDFGRYLAGRFTDAEIIRVADATTDSIARRTREVRGWRGIVSPGACGPCRANAGLHAASDELYRHGGCGCSREWVVA
jgi:hypothetical protein